MGVGLNSVSCPPLFLIFLFPPPLSSSLFPFPPSSFPPPIPAVRTATDRFVQAGLLFAFIAADLAPAVRHFNRPHFGGTCNPLLWAVRSRLAPCVQCDIPGTTFVTAPVR